MSEPKVLETVQRLAVAALLDIDGGKCSLDDVLDRTESSCRRTLEHLLLNVFRFRKSIRKAWSGFCTKMPAPETAALLDVCCTQCKMQSGVAPQSAVNVAVQSAKRKHADKFVNAIMRKFLQSDWQKPESAAEILPDAVLKRWQKEFAPETVAEFAGLFISEAPFTFRLVKDAEIPENCTACAAPGRFRFAVGKAREILSGAEFASGKYYVQDPAAAMAVTLAQEELRRSQKVLDVCAAPGGKSLLMAELLPPEAFITAADKSHRRQELTGENFRKYRINGEVITATPDKIRGVYDLVFADVPCSNTGVFRRRPDALWRFSEAALRDVMALQKKIITRAAELVAPGGFLVCSTCSIESDENNALAPAGFTVIKTETLLPSAEHDGAFAALCQKN